MNRMMFGGVDTSTNRFSTKNATMIFCGWFCSLFFVGIMQKLLVRFPQNYGKGLVELKQREAAQKYVACVCRRVKDMRAISHHSQRACLHWKSETGHEQLLPAYVHAINAIRKGPSSATMKKYLSFNIFQI